MRRENFFTPSVTYFMGPIDVYDREDELGDVLWKYDPNEVEDRNIIIKEFILKGLSELSREEKKLLFDELETCLSDPSYDFSKCFDCPYDDELEYAGTAWTPDEIDSPREFFLSIHRIAKIEWREELEKTSVED